MADVIQTNGKAAEDPKLEAGTPAEKKEIEEEEHYKPVSYFELFK